MELEFVPSHKTAALAIRCQRDLNERFVAKRPAPAKEFSGVGGYAMSLLSTLTSTVSTKRDVADEVDPETLEKASVAIGQKLFRAVGTLARQKPKKALPILKRGKFEAAIESALVERLGIDEDAPAYRALFDALATEFSEWAVQNEPQLGSVGMARRDGGSLVFSLAGIQAKAPKPAGRVRIA